MFLLNSLWLLLVLTCVKAEMWQLPTAVDIQKSLEACQMQDLLILDARRNGEMQSTDSSTNKIRCFTTQLGLWSDEEGFKTKRFVELFNKHKQTEEIRLVINYCNEHHKQSDLDKWANEGFYCFASGSMGPWINEYVKHVYKTKRAYK